MNNEELISKIKSSMYRQCKDRGYATTVDILIDTGILAKQKHEDWRYGRAPYLEAVCQANLSKLTFVRRTMHRYAEENNLKPSFTYYKRWGVKKKGVRVTIPLRFSKSGNPGIEREYATHYVDSKRSKALQESRRKESMEKREKPMTLFINACVRSDSRTKRLADVLLSKWQDPVAEVKLEDILFPVADEAFLKKRDAFIAAGDYTDAMFSLAKQFAGADRIVIAAPYWDLSFPASLKQYFEQVNVLGVTFRYTPEGIPQGLCRAKQLYYVMTAGGNYVPEEYGFGYVKALAQSHYGIPDVSLVQAVGLDLDGADPEQILQEAMERIRQL